MTIVTDQEFIQQLTRVNYDLIQERDELQRMLDSALEQLQSCAVELERVTDELARANTTDVQRELSAHASIDALHGTGATERDGEP